MSHTPALVQILENAVENNEIYVHLCDSIQGMEGQIQRLHSVLAGLRTLSGELRYLSTADVGVGGESTSQIASAAVTQATGETSKLHRAASSTAETEPEPPELLPVLTVLAKNWCWLLIIFFLLLTTGLWDCRCGGPSLSISTLLSQSASCISIIGFWLQLESYWIIYYSSVFARVMSTLHYLSSCG